MWCTAGKGYITRYNLDSNLNLIYPRNKFMIKDKNDYLDVVNISKLIN